MNVVISVVDLCSSPRVQGVLTSAINQRCFQTNPHLKSNEKHGLQRFQEDLLRRGQWWRMRNCSDGELVEHSHSIHIPLQSWQIVRYMFNLSAVDVIDLTGVSFINGILVYRIYLGEAFVSSLPVLFLCPSNNFCSSRWAFCVFL